MKGTKTLKLRFVESAPDKLEGDTLYVSMEFATALHKCCCGCGHEVVTPLSPEKWKLHFDGVSVSLSPSIGNWSFPCQSHYWIRRNQIEWAPHWSKATIDECREMDRQAKEKQIPDDSPRPEDKNPHPARKHRWWHSFLILLGLGRAR